MSSTWPDKYVIGVTGNIATGKSVVRKMLEHLGAYGVDADALSHRVMLKGAPGYQPIVATFGKWILSPDGQIDRKKLGDLVFPNPEALAMLEKILHPLIRQSIDILIRRSTQPVIVIEAIKLFEGDLHQHCDTIWVSDADEKTQIKRLVNKRGMTHSEARQRAAMQDPQAKKLAVAKVIIRNNESFEKTWEQVSQAWEKYIPKQAPPAPSKQVEAGKLGVHRAGPKEAQKIADFITRASQGARRLTRTDIMADFGEKAFLLLESGDTIAGLVGWKVENLVARVDDFVLAKNIPFNEAIRAMMNEIESASSELLCEALLLFLPPNLAQHTQVWAAQGYTPRTVKDLSVRAWQEAAMESMTPGSVLYFKQLRKDRVLRPI
ncbi:MAG: dephospho-CoA kinase [Anaerolineae bacterium]|nr:dephospho-CoA kinase [Anaerolineae bacterium]MBL6966377.1 dephospho-CoA kinase [Anaerolineales bacterium]